MKRHGRAHAFAAILYRTMRDLSHIPAALPLFAIRFIGAHGSVDYSRFK
jgi:hypothetical protein